MGLRGALLDHRNGKIPKELPAGRQEKAPCFDLAMERLSQSVANNKQRHELLHEGVDI